LSRPRYKAVTLDLVGTIALFDPAEEIIARFAAAKGYPVGVEEARRAIRATRVSREGKTPREFYIELNEAVLRALGIPGTGEELLAYWFDPGNYRVEPCVPGALAELRGAGVKLGIVSNNLSWEVEALLGEAGLTGLFDAVATPDTAGVFKPHPGIFHYALRLLQAGPAEALHAGDSLREDYEAARAAGMDAVLVAERCPPRIKCIRSVCPLPPEVLG